MHYVRPFALCTSNPMHSSSLGLLFEKIKREEKTGRFYQRAVISDDGEGLGNKDQQGLKLVVGQESVTSCDL